MLKIWITTVCVAVLGTALPPVVSAQSGSPEPASVRRPFRGIFGGSSGRESAHSLVFTGSIYGAYDDNVIEALTDNRTRDPFLQRSGTYQGATAGLNYHFEKSGDRLSFGLSSGTQVRYYRRSSDANTAPYYHGDVFMEWQITRSTTFRARQSAAYSSNYNFALTPLADEEAGHDIAIMDDPDLELFQMRAVRTASSLILTQKLWRNTSLVAGYNYRAVNVVEDAARQGAFSDYGTHAGSVGIKHTRRLTSHAELDLGYGVRVSDRRSGTGEPRVMHNINAGINYSRALSFSRRTSLSFGSGSSILTTENLQDPDAEPRTRFRLNGNASLVHEMGRTWTAQLSYSRGVRARDGFGELYFTDGVTAGVGGLVTRRISWTSMARWSMSTLDRPGRNGHRGMSATSQASYAINSILALYARYVYYQYSYDEDIPLDPRLPRELDRQGVRVGLTTSIPLIR